MARGAILKLLLLVAALALGVFVVNHALRPGQSSAPTVAGIQRQLTQVVATKLVQQGFEYHVTGSCAPPPDYTLTPPLHLVCTVTAHDVLRPKKSPVWVEDVTCGLPVPAWTPNCGSSGGDALQ